MKKNIVVTLLTLIIAILVVQSGVINSFFVFLLIGAIPGTAYVISPSAMLLTIALIICFILVRFTAVEALFAYTDKRTTKHHAEHKKRLPQRRFSEI